MNSYTKNVNVAFLIRLFLLVLFGNSCAYAQLTASNVCPATTVDLTTHVTETPPSGTLITWHTGTPATQANRVATPTQAGAGVYYAAYFDVATSCYGNTTGSLAVTINACAPINNVCPATTVDLTTHLVGTPASGTLITWHTGTPASQANRVANPTQVTTGLYYAAYFDVATSCYGNTTGPLSVSIVPCPSPAPDNGAVIAGVGGTAIPNVTTNDLVGGQAVVLGSNATIAPVGTYPPGIVLNLSTGAVTVATSTAPSTYTLAYQLCTTASTPSCATTTITITVNAGGTTSPDAGTVSAGAGGTAIPNVAANDAVNGVPATLGATGNATVATIGTYPPGITLDPATGSVSVATGTAPGTYPVVYQLCDKLTPITCTTGLATITVSPIVTANPNSGTVSTGVGGTAIPNVAANDVVNGLPATLGATGNATVSTVGTYPAGITLNPATGSVSVAIGTTPSTYTLVYQLCDKLSPITCTTTTATVTVTSSVTAGPDSGTAPATGGVVVANVTTNDSVNGVPATLGATGNATVATVGTYPAGITLNPATGSVNVAVGTTPGSYTVAYQLCDKLTPATCATAAVTITITPSLTANPDAGTVSSGTGGTAIANVVANDVVNGVPATLGATGNATIASVGTYPVGITLNPATGSVSAAVGTVPGTYTVVYQLCDKLTPSTCTTANATVTVTASVTALPDTGTASSGIAVPNVAANDVVNGVPATLGATGNATVSTVGTYPAGITLNPATGGVSVAVGTMPGTYTVVYQLCDKLTPTTCATSVVAITVGAFTNTTPDAGTVSAGTGGTAIANVVANDVVNGLPATLGATGNAILSTVGTYPPGITLNPTTGSLSVATGTVPGTYTLVYQLCDKLTPATCMTSTATVTVSPSVIASPDAGTVSAGTGGVAIANVTTNDGVNGIPATLGATGNATIASVGTYPVGITLNPATGSVSVAIGTTPGTYTVVYQLCDKLSPITCTTTTATVTVTSSVTAAPDSGTAPATGGTAIANVVANDVVNGVPATLGATGNATVSTVGTYPVGITLNPATGSVSAAVGTVPGTYTVVYQLCDKLTPSTCTTANATVTVTASVTALPDTGTASSGIAVPNVAANDVVNGVPATLGATGNATVSTVGTYPAGITLNPATGGVSVAVGTMPGTYTVVYQLCDKLTPTTCATSVVAITVGAFTNTTPDTGTVSAGTGGIAVPNVVANDVVNGLPATLGATGNATVSTVGTYPAGITLNPATGSVSVAVGTTPGTYTLVYQLCDKLTPTTCTTATATVTVLPVAPMVTPDIALTKPNTPVSGNVLTNDSDLQGLPLTASVTTPPTVGTVVMSPTGSYTYTPPANFTGVVSFCYTASNTAGLSASTCVTVMTVPDPTVGNDAPVALNDNTQTTAGTPITVNVLANDVDPDSATTLNGQLANPTLVSQPSVGTAVVNTNGTVTYTSPAGFTGVVSFPYQVCDKATPALCATAVVSVNVLPTPPVGTTLAPVAVDDALLTGVNTPKVGNVAANDSDPQGLPLTYASGQPASGTVVMSPAGSYTYTPAAGYVGPTSFTYSVCNSAAKCDVATVSVLVQAPPVVLPPVATPDIANTNPNTPVSGNVLTNDVDPQGLPLTASLLSPPAAGTVTISPTGSYVYTPPTGFTGSVSFCYSVSNSGGQSSSACVTVNVNPAPSPLGNDAPVANNDNSQTTAGVSLTINVVANDTDPDSPTTLAGQLGTPVIVSQPTTGTASVVNGLVVYTPPVGFTGVVSFPYQVCDKATPALCATAVVSVNVLPTPPVGTTLAPVALDDALLVSPNTSSTGTVAANDSDPQGLPLTFTPGQPVNGAVVMSPTGSYTYTPTPGYIGPDSFTYSVCNSAGKCDVATVTVLIQPNTSMQPIVTPDIANTSPGKPVTGNVLTNDLDPQGAPLIASVTTPPAAGTVVMSPTGSYTFTPPAGFTGTVSFCYTATNTIGLSASTCVSINVNPDPSPLVNDRPVANNDNTQTTSGVPVIIAVLANDVDPNSTTTPDGQLNNPALVSQPSVGTAVVNANGTVTYTPPTGFTGVVSFPYQVCDKATPALCATAVVSVNVLPTPPVGTTLAPVAVDDALLTGVNTPKVGNVAANDSDPQGLPLTYASGQPASGTVVMSPAGSYTYTPAPGYVGPTSFTYSVCNSAAKCDVATVSVLIQQPLNQPPLVTPDVNTFIPGTLTTGNVLTNDKDPEGTPLTASVVGTPPPGFTMSPNGSYTYTAPASQTAPVTIPVQVCDSATPPGCVTSTLTLTPAPNPTPANDAPIALNDATRTTAGVSTTVNVLANDRDPEGLPLSNPTLVSGPTQGTATVNPNGTVTYTPPAGFTGVDQVTYQVCDTGSPVRCTTAVVTFTVDPTPPAGVTNVAPVAIDDQLLTTKNVSVTGTVAANDSDANLGQALTFSKLTNPANGTVVLTPAGSYSFVPAPGFVGTDHFTYQVCDSGSPVLCTVATVYITVNEPASLPPVVTPDIALARPNTPVLGNVLTNDADPQGQPLTASVTSPPTVGTVVMSPTGSYTYTPPANFTGVVSFCYTATNTVGLSMSTCVSVNVVAEPTQDNGRPIANNDNTQTTSGVPIVIAVLANDTDPDNATSLNGQLSNPVLLSQPSVGTAVVNANGTVTYTSPAGFTGVVTFPYQVCDKATPALCATAVVNVDVQPTPPVGTTLAPVAVDDALLTGVNTPKMGNVAANDSDPQGLPLTYASGQPVSGTVVMSPTGSYTYTPALGYTGPVNFTYSVCNSAGKCDVATVSVLVQQPVSPTAVVLRLKVMLQGALIGGTGGLMRDDLRSQQFLPMTEPYSAAGVNNTRFTHVNGGGGETMPASVTALNVGTGDAVVDWVFVELRSPSNLSLVVATRSALVQRDGDVVLASDGVSPLSFSGLSGSFYVSVKHRNHLGAMTATSIPLSATGTLVDFTTMTGPQLYNKTIGVYDYEGWEQITVSGKQALWAGDANHNGKVKYQGTANDLALVFTEVFAAQAGSPNAVYNYNNALGYYFGDVNMDGKVKYQGTSNDTSLIFTNLITNFQTTTQMNSGQLYNFDFMLEQIP